MLELHVFWRVRNEKEKNNKYDNWSNKKMKKRYKIQIKNRVGTN